MGGGGGGGLIRSMDILSSEFAVLIPLRRDAQIAEPIAGGRGIGRPSSLQWPQSTKFSLLRTP